MEDIVIPGGLIQYFEKGNVLYVKFTGNITDKDYSNIWTTLIDKGVELDSYKFIFDQTEVGKVSFVARGGIIMKHLPRIKNELGGDRIRVGLLSSKSMVSRSGVKYMVGMFEKMIGLKIFFYTSKEDAAIALAEM